jgi:hypothetical protein
MDLKEMRHEDMVLVYLAADTVQWRTVLNTEMNLRVS